MAEERVPEDELLHVIRGRGVGAIEDVAGVVLETDGEFSVIPKGTTSLSALGPVIEQAGDAQTTGDKAA